MLGSPTASMKTNRYKNSVRSRQSFVLDVYRVLQTFNIIIVNIAACSIATEDKQSSVVFKDSQKTSTKTSLT